MPDQSTDNLQRIKICQAAAWGLSLIVSMVAFIVWGSDYNWKIASINSYQLFPLFGLLAFSLMWSHYVAGTVRQLLGLEKQVLADYFKSTSLLVLILICLHPGLLIYQRFRDGYGLPPGSYKTYVAPTMSWVVMLGAVSLLVFLAYELHRFFANRPWWKYVQAASDLAMLAILYHGLRLGTQLQMGWFKYVWIFYGVSLVVVLARKYMNRLKKIVQSSI